MAKIKEHPTISEQEIKYFDSLAFLFERVAWVTIFWAFILNLFSPSNQEAKNYTFLIIFSASVFNFLYFRYFYRLIRKYPWRFFPSEILFPLFIWSFVHLHSEFYIYFLLPYYILLLTTSLTLNRSDVLLALGSSLVFIILETVILRLPLSTFDRTLAIGQITAILVYTWVVLKLAGQFRKQFAETGQMKNEISEVEKKTSILKEFTSELVLDRQKAEILIGQFPKPLLLLDHKNKIVETNQSFKNLSDFKDERLVGKDLSYVLKLGTPLNFDQKSFIPEEFEARLLTRRNKEKKVTATAHFLLGRDQRLKQILIIMTSF